MQYRFSKATLEFIKKASRQRKPDWLDRNREEYERVLLNPLQDLAQKLKSQLASKASGYHFPQKGIGRLKRSAHRAAEYGGLFKDWVSYQATRPAASRFDKNPNLFFLIQTDDPDGDNVLVAGGLYMPTSRQVRAIREAIAQDASAFDQLFASKAFAKRFPGGFSKERTSTRAPRGFDPNHPRLDWLKLQAFFVWRSYTMREFSSADFAKLVASDFEQVLRLNELLDLAIQGRLTSAAPGLKRKRASASGSDLSTRLEGIVAPRREMDF